jgi:hypothetical protein
MVWSSVNSKRSSSMGCNVTLVECKNIASKKYVVDFSINSPAEY